MASTAAANRPPPVHQGPNGGNLPFRPSSGLPNSGQLDPGLPGTSHDPGSSSHPHPQHTRPFFYVPAPPPPPFLQCQWPMPMSYNPFSVFPGMGYGMVMPPFPPPLPPYMETPTYFLPPSHIPPMEYRRMPHPQVHAPNASYQISNQTRRIRLPHSVPVRETVSSAVQTEPTQRGLDGYNDRCRTVRADSGHETVSNSPSPSSSSSHKRGSVEVDNYTPHCSNTNTVQGNRHCTRNPVKHGLNSQHPTETKTAQGCIRASAEKKRYHKECVRHEEVLPYGNERCKMWSVGSADSVGPMCSSAQQEDESVRDGGVSIPDILSWGGGGGGGGSSNVPQEVQEDDAPPQSNNHRLSDVPEVEQEKSDHNIPVRPQDDPVMADSHDVVNAENGLSTIDCETLFKILQLPFEPHELHPESRGETEQGACDGEQESLSKTNLHDESSRRVPYQRFNDSVWSVESLVPFIPTKEWLLQKGITDPALIVRTPEKEVKNDRPSGKSLKSGRSRRQSRRFSFPDTVSMCDSWPSFSTPINRQNENGINTSEDPKHGQSIVFDPSLSPTELPRKMVLSTSSEKDVTTQRSSDPRAHQSPNQESLIRIDQQEENCRTPEKEMPSLNHEEGKEILSLQNGEDKDVDRGNKEIRNLGGEQLCVPETEQRINATSPSKGHLVDCGVQCTDLQPWCKHCKELGSGKGLPLKNTGSSGHARGFCMNAAKPKGHANGKEKKRRAASWTPTLGNA